MEKILICCAMALLSLSACKKDKPVVVSAFDELNYVKISALESQFTSNVVSFTDATGDLLKPGAIILYKTTGGSLGKLILKASVSADPEHKLVFDLVTYGANGNVLLTKKDVVLPIGQVYNLDTGTSVGSGLGMSLYWLDTNPAFTLNSQNSAIFYVYSTQ